MNANELTYNELDPQDFIPVDWCSIDLTSYEYTVDLEVCFKLQVWNLQCKFGKLVSKYVDHLKYGINCDDLFITLTKFKLGLEILNNYNPRDIANKTNYYNTIDYSTIIKIIAKLNSY